jgi:large subunit ribosomal protein L13
VVVINAEKVRVSGKKEDQKTYMSYSGFRRVAQDREREGTPRRHPELMVERAIAA